MPMSPRSLFGCWIGLRVGQTSIASAATAAAAAAAAAIVKTAAHGRRDMADGIRRIKDRPGRRLGQPKVEGRDLFRRKPRLPYCLDRCFAERHPIHRPLCQGTMRWCHPSAYRVGEGTAKTSCWLCSPLPYVSQCSSLGCKPQPC
jgi:hypothetical protein